MLAVCVREGCETFSYLFPGVVGDGSKRGGIDGAEGELFFGPHAVEVFALVDVAVGGLEKESKRPGLVGHNRQAGAFDG